MKMRWYQHSEQVGSFMISPKNKAPSVDALAISHATKMIVQPVVVSVLVELISVVAIDW